MNAEIATPSEAAAAGTPEAFSAPVTEDAKARDEILANLGVTDADETEVDEGPAGAVGAEAAAAAKKDEPPVVDEDAEAIKAINARSRARRQAREASKQAPAAVASAASVESAQAAAKTAEAAAAKPVSAAPAAEAKPNEVAQAVRDVLAQIERLAGEDEAAVAAASASGKPDAGAEARAAELKAIRATVDQIASGLKETSALKEDLAKLQADLRRQADEQTIKSVIAEQIDAIAGDVPTVSSNARHDVQIVRDGVKRTVRMTGQEIVRDQAEKFFNKYKVAPDLKELARRIEKKLAAGSGPTETAKNGEKTTPTRKTISSSQSSPPAARQGPDKRSGKDAEADLWKRLGVDDEAAAS